MIPAVFDDRNSGYRHELKLSADAKRIKGFKENRRLTKR